MLKIGDLQTPSFKRIVVGRAKHNNKGVAKDWVDSSKAFCIKVLDAPIEANTTYDWSTECWQCSEHWLCSCPAAIFVAFQPHMCTRGKCVFRVNMSWLVSFNRPFIADIFEYTGRQDRWLSSNLRIFRYTWAGCHTQTITLFYAEATKLEHFSPNGSTFSITVFHHWQIEYFTKSNGQNWVLNFFITTI